MDDELAVARFRLDGDDTDRATAREAAGDELTEAKAATAASASDDNGDTSFFAIAALA